MTSFKFIHTADIHLDSPLRRLEHNDGAPVAEIRGASRRAFEDLIALALGEAVGFCSDRRRRRDEKEGLANQLRHLSAGGTDESFMGEAAAIE